MTRGSLIIFEGCDRAGKTTCAKDLVDFLINNQIKAKYLNFPNRNTTSGKYIDQYLKNEANFTKEGIHLMFSINRWEFKESMEKDLQDGVTLVVDRYAYSGVAFSMAKGLDYEWCMMPDRGLIKPDLVIYLTMNIEEMKKRSGFGNERYETLTMQEKVMTAYTQLIDDNWKLIDATQSIDMVFREIKNVVMEKIQEIKSDVLETL